MIKINGSVQLQQVILLIYLELVCCTLVLFPTNTHRPHIPFERVRPSRIQENNGIQLSRQFLSMPEAKIVDRFRSREVDHNRSPDRRAANRTCNEYKNKLMRFM